ncbi:unnamed protein product [Natator depressus]
MEKENGQYFCLTENTEETFGIPSGVKVHECELGTHFPNSGTPPPDKRHQQQDLRSFSRDCWSPLSSLLLHFILIDEGHLGFLTCSPCSSSSCSRVGQGSYNPGKYLWNGDFSESTRIWVSV